MAESAIEAAAPKRLGRFEVQRLLGRGRQGRVYLARDPELDREVALKTLNTQGGQGGPLREEARRVARLTHPRIVQLHDLAEDGGQPFLVFAFVPGESLADRLKHAGALPPETAVRIAIDLLEGLAYAHQQGILHRDLSQRNVLLDAKDRAHILDFGVAVMLSGGTTRAEVIGTPAWMAPEALQGGTVDARADVYAVSVLLHEMLTGQRLFAGEDAMSVMYQVTQGDIRAPHLVRPESPATLDPLVMKGLARRPNERFVSATEMREALMNWLEPDSNPEHRPADSDAAAFLIRRMRRNPDFPAVSQHIAEINQRASHSDDSDASELAHILLKDYALTTKVLKAVNAACYGQYGGKITTVSRAVVILGYEQVRILALSILLFDHMKNAQQAGFLKEAACAGFMSALLAHDLATGLADVNAEEAFIAAMLHTLGRCLAIYYFPDEYAEVRQDMAQHGREEQNAARRVLGATFFELGAAVAREWNLPDSLVRAIAEPPMGELKPCRNPGERLCQVAFASNALCSAATAEAPLEDALPGLMQRFGKALPLTRKQMEQAVHGAKRRLEDYARIVSIDLTHTEAYRNIDRGPEPERPAGDADFDVTSEHPSGDGSPHGDRSDIARVGEGTGPEGCRILLDCITELTSALLEDYRLNEILSVYLESVYRGMAFQRVLLLLRDLKSNTMVARLGLGTGLGEILPAFRFGVAREDDLLNRAVRGQEAMVLNLATANREHPLPEWCLRLTQPAAVLVSPIVVERRCLAMVYGDYAQPNPPLSAEHLRLYRALTNQVRLAFQQKRAS